MMDIRPDWDSLRWRLPMMNNRRYGHFGVTEILCDEGSPRRVLCMTGSPRDGHSSWLALAAVEAPCDEQSP